MFGPDDKPRIDYPCVWEYRVIGTDTEALQLAIREVIGAAEHSLKPGNRNGKFLSLSLEIEVRDEAERNRIHREIGAQAVVRMVL